MAEFTLTDAEDVLLADWWVREGGDHEDLALDSLTTVVEGFIGGRLKGSVGVLAEMERHGDLSTRVYYGSKLRAALGVTGPVECVCVPCDAKAGA